MKSLTRIPESERQHYLKCTVCGHYLDMRDLSDVFAHEHDKNLPEPKFSKSKRLHDNAEYLKGKHKVNLN